MSRCAVRALALSLLLICLPKPARAQPCPLDCDGDGEVEIAELAAGVEVALLRPPAMACAAAGESVAVDLVVAAVLSRLGPCGPALTATPTASPTPGLEPTPTATPLGAQIPPASSAALLAWLRDGSYLGWQSEAQVHASAGPHFGRVRTYLNDAVFSSLQQGNAQHPAGAALVKELYGNGATVRGWSVMVKTQDDSAGGQGWYWYERFDDSTFAAGNGVGLCFNCHASTYNGLPSRDHVLTPFPLQ